MSKAEPTGTDETVAFLMKKWRIPRSEARRLLNIQRAEGQHD